MTMNALLVRIVRASNGVVTDPNNRNQLLQDWLNAIRGRLIYNFDGVDDYITIPQCDLVAGDTVTFKFIAPSEYGSNRVLLSNADNSNNFKPYITPTGELVNINSNFTVTLDGVEIDDGHIMPNDSLPHSLIFTIESDGVDVKFVASNSSGGSSANFPIYDLDIQAVSGNRRYLINDGWAANPVIADSIGGANGTAVNFDESNWIYYK